MNSIEVFCGYLEKILASPRYPQGNPIIQEILEDMKEMPDEITWIDEKTQLECKIWRNPEIGILCGYVHIPFNLVKREINESKLLEKNYDAHWGITHNKKVTDKKIYVLGFDCGHGGDCSPYTWHAIGNASKSEFVSAMGLQGTYRNVKYVKEECKKLAKQIKDTLDADPLVKLAKKRLKQKDKSIKVNIEDL